jgi:glycosyltransferase involved in cell wall biosynthesis
MSTAGGERISGEDLQRFLQITRRVDNPESSWLSLIKYPLYDHIVTISDGIRKVLLSEGITPAKITLIHSAVDLNRYKSDCNKDWFYREFGLSPDNQLIGTVAQFIPRKGHRYIIDAAPSIIEKRPRARFLFFGQGPMERELKTLCKQRGLENIILFPGFRTDLERILPCLDMLLHPATMEGLGIALLQAAASEIPIIGCRAGGIPEIVNDWVNGFLIAPGDVNSIITTVLTLLGDAEIRMRFGRAGRRIVESSFSIDMMVERYIDLYLKITKKTDEYI